MDKKGYCCFCFNKYDNYGNDIRPLTASTGDRCCDRCNLTIVIPNRIKFWCTNVTEIYLLKDTRDNHYIDVTGLPNSAVNLFSEYIIKFTNLEDALQYIKDNDLAYCEPVRILAREDN
jgi:hypothetical protein